MAEDQWTVSELARGISRPRQGAKTDGAYRYFLKKADWSATDLAQYHVDYVFDQLQVGAGDEILLHIDDTFVPKICELEPTEVYYSTAPERHTMDSHYPTKRPIDAEYVDEDDTPEFPSELTNIPWVDIHNHAHTLSWNDREKFALSGCQAMVMMAAAYYWTPYKPVAPEDVQYLWDDALNRLDQIRQSHIFDATLGIGIHTGARVEEYDTLLELLPEYCQLDEVSAVGEIGITSAQHVARWDLEDQKEVTRRQMEIAHDNGLPAVLHTPPNLNNVDIPFRTRGTIPGYELDMGLQQDPALEAEDIKQTAVEIDIELKDEANLSDNRLVLSHGDSRVAPYVMENTDCYLGFTVSYPWLLGVTPRDVAAVIEEYGPDRILVETDSAGILRSDVFSFKRTIFELYRMGLDVETIKTVVYENPRRLLD